MYKGQRKLIDKLILNKNLNERYKNYGLCKNCKQINTNFRSFKKWCLSCNSKHFEQNFKNWTSGNHHIDKLIQTIQLNADSYENVLEWIEYNRFKKVRDSNNDKFTYEAIWKDGNIKGWDFKSNQWKRYGITSVLLKCIDITVISKEVRYFFFLIAFRIINSNIKIDLFFLLG